MQEQSLLPVHFGGKVKETQISPWRVDVGLWVQFQVRECKGRGWQWGQAVTSWPH